MPGVNGASGSNAWSHVTLLHREAKETAMSQGVQNSGTTPPATSSSETHAGGSPPPSPNSAAGDARATTATSPDGYSNEQLKALSELEQDPSFALLKDQLSHAESLMNSSAFRDLENKWGKGSSDGKLSWADIEWAVAGRDRGTSSEALALADYLFGHEDVFNAIDKNGNGEITQSEINAYIQSVKQQIFDKKKEVLGRAGSSTNTTDGTGSSGGAGGTGSTGRSDGSTTTKPTMEELLKPPEFHSTATDPAERMADCVGCLQDKIDQLYAGMTDNLSQADMSKLQGQIAKLQAMMQMLMSAMQQQQQMMSNIAKMWSDMAMNSIRNMK